MSSDGANTMELTSDGKLSVKNGGTPLWESVGKGDKFGPYTLKMLADSNMVVYDKDGKVCSVIIHCVP